MLSTRMMSNLLFLGARIIQSEENCFVLSKVFCYKPFSASRQKTIKQARKRRNGIFLFNNHYISYMMNFIPLSFGGLPVCTLKLRVKSSVLLASTLEFARPIHRWMYGTWNVLHHITISSQKRASRYNSYIIGRLF